MTTKKENNPGKETPFVPKVKRTLVLPLLNRKMKPGDSVYFKITSPVFEGKQIASAEAKQNEKPADLVNAVDLTTGEECQVIVPAVMKSVLEDEYDDGAYIGLAFELTKGEKAEGKRYYNYTVNELEL